MMRSIALGLLLAASACLPAFAAEPDGPTNLIDQKEAVRIGVQGQLADKAGDSSMRKAQKDALIEYYLVPDQPLLWVDDNGLTDRAKSVMAEIGKADDYGLTRLRLHAARSRRLQRHRSQGQGLARRCRGEGRAMPCSITPTTRAAAASIRSGSSKNLDPSLALPNPSEVLESIAIRSDPAAYLRSFQPDQPQFEALQAEAARAPRRQGRGAEARRGHHPATDRCSNSASSNEQVALLRQAARRARRTRTRTEFDEAVLDAVQQFQRCARLAARRRGRLRHAAPAQWRPAARAGRQAPRASSRSWSTWSAGAGCRTTSARST